MMRNLIFMLLSGAAIMAIAPSALAEITLPVWCRQEVCYETKIIKKTLLLKQSGDRLYSIDQSYRYWKQAQTRPAKFDETKISYVYCSTTRPAYIFKSDHHTYYAHLLNPGGGSGGYNYVSYQTYWAACHDIAGPDYFSERITSHAIQLGYPLNLESNQIELDNVREILPQSVLETPESSCHSALLAGVREFQKIGNVKVEKSSKSENFWTDYRSSGNEQEDHPVGRPRGINFTLSGAGVDSIMKSPQFSLNIITHAIRACPDVSTVSIGVNGSDWSMTAGYFDDGSIRWFECADGDPRDWRRRQSIPYGYLSCAGSSPSN
jgi:hypothetical protein